MENQSNLNGVKLNSGDRTLWLLPVSDTAIRVVYSAKETLSGQKSLIIIPQPEFYNWEQEEKDGKIIVRTKELQVTADPATLGLSWQDGQGRTLFREPTDGKVLEEADLVKYRFNGQEELQMQVTADGLRVKNDTAESYVDRTAYHAKLKFEFGENEALYGLGSHEDGVMNLRGTHQYLYQQNMKACVPVLVSSRGYGVLFDACSLMTFHDDFYGSYVWMEYVDQLDYYVMLQGKLGTASAYRQLTGAAPMLPKWAFGYIQSKERYRDAKELVETAKEYRNRGIPLDCIVLDWCSWEGDLWGEKKLDSQRFPDPDALTRELHHNNVRLMTSIWPNMAPGGTNWAEMREKGFLLGNRSTYNAFSEQARQLYWNQANEGLFAHGVDAWWCDCTEPFEGDWKGPVKPEPEACIAINCDEARKYLDPAYLNAYSLLHSQGIYEGQRRTSGQKRVINLTRSSYAGQHRYATVTWSGDTAASWDTLRRQVPAGLNFCATGEPYWTVDIGGFFVRKKEQWFWAGEYEDGCADPAYREMYLRWFQYGTFLPMFRSHGTDTPREVWRFGEPGEVIYDALVRFIRLRYRLMPYIYSLAGASFLFGAPMMTPLGLAFPDDPTASSSTEFLFGPSLLVAPVLEPAPGGEHRMSVYLPAGCGWYDFWTNVRYEGGQELCIPVTLDTIPVFVREGSVLPLAVGEPCHTGEIDPTRLDIRVYTGANGVFALYEDEGDGYGYENGAYAITQLFWEDGRFSASVSGGYPGFCAEKDYHVEQIR